MKIFAKAPVRVDFGGGTTDIFPFTKHGGAVLNGAIDKYVNGSILKLPNRTILEYHADIPTSSGLGTSGVMNVVWLALTTGIKDKMRLAEFAYSIERDTGVIGGKQDQYAAAFGGINYFSFKNHDIKIQKINLKNSFVKKLESGFFLYYTGPRLSSEFNKVIVDNVLKNNFKTINILKNIVENTKKMKEALLNYDLSGFCDLINNEWMLRKSLHPKLTTPKIEKAISFAMEHGAIAAKVCGAGGGGCILFYAHNKLQLMKRFNNAFDFRFDTKGLKVWR